MALTVKAFLAKDGVWDAEIRRCQVPVDASYEYLHKKLCEIFPSLKQGQFSLCWKDADGDVVAFSTDEELTEALGHVSDGVFKVYVTIRDAVAENQQEEIHPGVVCDGCDSSIRGPRFKCLVCPNYDLCRTCEGKGLHMEHDKMKIASPGGFPGFPMFPFGPHGGPPGGPHFGPHGGSHMGPFGVSRGRRGGPHGIFAPPPHFRHWMQKFMKRWHKRNAPGWNSGEEDGQGKSDEKGEREEKMEESGESGESSGEELLLNAGECMADMVQAVGLESDDNADPVKGTDDSDNQGKRCGRGRGRGHGRKCHGRKEHGHKGHEVHEGHWGRRFQGCPRGRGRHSPYHFGPWAFWGWQMDDDWQQGVCPGRKGKCWKKGNCKSDGEEASKEPQQCNAMEKGMAKCCMKHAKKHAKMMAKIDKKKNVPSSQTTQADNDCVLVGEEAMPVLDGTVPMPQPQPVVPGQTPIPSQLPVFKHAEALQQLLTMGFNNEGGWLARLLDTKSGDIGQVLEAIKPQCQQ